MQLNVTFYYDLCLCMGAYKNLSSNHGDVYQYLSFFCFEYYLILSICTMFAYAVG